MKRVSTSRTRRYAAGMSVIYTLLLLGAVMGIISLGVDWGHVQLVKTELTRAADAAARYAAANIGNGITTAQDAAVSAAAENLVDGTALVLNTSADIEFGTWNQPTKTFSVLTGSARGSANAIRVTARRTQARGNAVRLFFAQVLGPSTCDVIAQVIAQTGAGPYPFIGLNGLTAGNNTFVGSYNSAVTTVPTPGTSSAFGSLGSNGTIVGGSGSTVNGSIQLGPAASTSGFTINGTTVNLPAPFATPSSPTWSPVANPAGVPQNYSVTSNTTLPGGTYWLTSLSMNANRSLSFSGAATIYLNGPASFGSGDTITAYNSIPSNLMIYQLGSNDFGDNDCNALTITAVLEGPNSNFKAKNNCTIYGKATFNTMTMQNNAEFYCDESLKPSGAAAASQIRMVK